MSLFPMWGAVCSAFLFWEACKYSLFVLFNVKFKASTGLLCSVGEDVVVAVVLCRWYFALGDVQLFE